MRNHILETNLVEKDAGQEDLVGNIYKFSHNRNFYDSLESLEIYRNEEPEQQFSDEEEF